ncbi:hypothetical protein FLK61_26605 [Paenalkalicoccus suaedae]|uniref:Transcriptional regulator n=1 Tax=Paenalkalicoccus suaedae TaxID=2592382 RepID=A0A859FBJ4_9BACI|nr:hypothetical protein [Paenalkalicoccus suaedae]QKS70330.1 hypothetical protein FLK61_26605 [Paenalkalicoccus suaedae]
MKVRLGILGPRDSVSMMEEVVRPFEDFDWTSYYYETTEETEDLIKQAEGSVDCWLFSGQAPYAYALQKGLVQPENAFFPPLHGASLVGALLNMFFHEKNPTHVTLDTIDEEEFLHVKSEHDLVGLDVTSYSYDGYRSADDIIQFHSEAHAENGSTIALTCIRYVYQTLRERGIPVYRITASRFDVSETLKFIRERRSASWYRSHQLAIIGIDVREPSTSLEDYHSFRRKHRELDLKRILYRYAEDVKGSFVQMGDGLFHLFTTRGEVERRPLPFALMEEVSLQTKLQIGIAIGYGNSAMQAETHVQEALQQVRRTDERVIYAVDEEKRQTEHFPSSDSVTYSVQSGDLPAVDKLKGRVAPGVVSKILSYARYHQQYEVTSKDLAAWLASSERNARRILHELEEAGYAEAIGEEQGVRRGRPRRLFKLMLGK